MCNLGDAKQIDLGDGVLLELVWIPPGVFVMGTPENSEALGVYERPRHRVEIVQGFWMGKYPITQEQWEVVTGRNPAGFVDAVRPVEMVSWEDCRSFLQRLNNRLAEGGFRLPSEAEWEYACRAGNLRSFLYCFGNDIEQLTEYAWFLENSDDVSQPVGQKRPNSLGLYDMHGNVWEWCEDEWHEDYEGAPDDGSAWAPGIESLRVARGGSWASTAESCRSAERSNCNAPNERDLDLGLRVVQQLSVSSPSRL